MKTLEQKIEVMQAALDGKEIECVMSRCPDCLWVESKQTWDWHGFDYRIKKEPIERYMVVFDDGRNSGRTYRSKEEAVSDWGELTTFKRVIKLREVTE